MRAALWLRALARLGRVGLVCPDGTVPVDVSCTLFPARRSMRRAFAGAINVMAGAPFQTMLASPYDWRAAIEEARRHFGRIDTAVVLLTRLDPDVRPLLGDATLILDAVDSLTRSMGERMREGSRATRSFWSEELRRIANVERGISARYDRIVVISDEDVDELDAVAVPNGVDIHAPGDGPRTFDFGFWGRLAYFANADAARWLLDEIWPAIRAQRPDATLLVGGADAPAFVMAAHGRDGITVRSPVDSVPAAARQVRVALMPVRYGTGQSNKILEAAEAGCALVATTKAMRGFERIETLARPADEVSAIVDRAVSLLDRDRWAAAGAELRAAAAQHYSREASVDRLVDIVVRAEAAA